MRVLVGCEESQVVCKAFRERGHEAYSCDLQPCSGGHPEWHRKGDIITILRNSGYWDLIILHPDCTAMAVSGNRWYGNGMPLNNKRKEAIMWTQNLWIFAMNVGNKLVLENPVSVIFDNIEYHKLQYIQPWQFGHGETKKTGLALWNLPPLQPTNIVEGRDQRIWRMPPSKDRKKLRSRTYEGIAKAMAEQWG